MRAPAAVALLVGFAPLCSAHQLDGYLQATTISLGRTRVWAFVRLTPGVNAYRQILSGIDTDNDGAVSPAESRAYAARVLRDLSFSVDGHRLGLRLRSSKFPATDTMKKGFGDIELSLDAAVPQGSSRRRLVFENRHQRRIAAYMVNLLAPDDPGFRVTSQSRSPEQSRYEVSYVQAPGLTRW